VGWEKADLENFLRNPPMIVFKTPGIADIEALTTFGVNVKKHANPIGYFGTGFKFALGVLLREGCEVKAILGGHVYNFTTVIKSISSKEFSVVLMNGEKLGFTTELGKNWKLSHAFRELYSNTIDERGEIISTSEPIWEEDTSSSYIIITSTSFEQAYKSRYSNILIPPTLTKIFSSSELEIFNNSSEYIYFQGINVLKKKSLFTYNFLKNIELTEDRTLLSIYYPQTTAAEYWLNIADNEDQLTRVFTAPPNTFEHDLTLPYFINTSQISPTQRRLLKSLRFNLQTSPNMAALAKKLDEEERGSIDPEETPISPKNQKILNKCLDILYENGYDLRMYPIILSDSLTSHLGLARNGKIFLSPLAFNRGTQCVLSTLFEEYIHLSRGYKDYTREFQDFVLEAFAKKIME
jgi:hypothetical protein